MNFTSYENRTHGFKLQYPEDWELIDDNPVFAAAIVSPYEDSSDYRAEVFVNIFEVDQDPRSFEEFKEEAPAQIKPLLNDFKVYEMKETILSSKKAHQIIYAGKMKFGRLKNLELKHLQVSTQIGKKYYQIGYSHNPNYYEEYLDLISKMMESFEIL